MKKKNLIALIFMFSSLTSFAENEKIIDSKLDGVTVFFKGAELTHVSSTSLTKGDNEVWIKDLSPLIDINSLKITASNGVVISAREFSIDYLNKKTPELITKRLQDSIKIYKEQMRQVEVKLGTNKNLLSLLDANKSIAGSQTGLKVDELMKMMTYYKTESTLLQNEQSTLNERSDKINEYIAKLQAQLDEGVTKNTKTDGLLKLHLLAPLSTSCNLTITYYTTQAHWSPYYDINVVGVDQPIKISSKAKISQTTGLDWDHVKLSLSTSTPTFGKIAPIFDTPWFLNNQSAPNIEKDEIQKDKDLDDVVVMATGFGVARKANTRDASPMRYVVDGQTMTEEEFSQIDRTSIANISTNGRVTIVTLKKMEDYVFASTNELNVTYNIDLPYTISGNGKIQAVVLKSQEIPATFTYYCAPKLDTETYLLAKIADWQKLNLLSGKANVTYAGTYVGETTINTASTEKTLDLTLGADKRVTVKREKLQDFSSTKFLGSDIKQIFTYQITVKNNQNRAIQMTLKEQYPISSQKEIEVDLLKDTTPSADDNKDLGILSWNLKMNAGETQTYKVSYSIKYPKDSNLNLQ